MMPVIDMYKTGENLKKKRNEKGISVREMQKACGLESPQAIYNWESGKRVPTIDNLVIVSRFFECILDELLVTYDVAM